MHQFFSPGFANDRTFDLANHWHEQGLKVHVITSSAYYSSHLHLPYPVTCIQVPYRNEMGIPRRIQSFFTFLQKANRILSSFPPPDLLYVTVLPISLLWLGKWWKANWQIPYVLEVTDLWPDVPIEMGVFSPFQKHIRKVIGPLYLVPDHLLPYSPPLKQLLHERYHVPLEKISVSYNGTNLTQLPFQKRFHSEGPLRALYAGTISRANGFSQWIEAFALLPPSKRFHIDLYSWGKELPKIRKLVNTYSLNHWIHFHDPVPKKKLYDLAKNYDVGIVSFAPFSILETNSAGKFYDYLAMGLPVLLNYRGWQGELVEQYKIGFSVPQGDTQALAALLVKIQGLSRKELYEAGIRARKVAEELFDRKTIAREVTQLLLSLTRQKHL